MSWLMLIVGIALWWLAHLFKRLAPDLRASLGGLGKPGIAVVLLLSVVLMVIGYGGIDYLDVWQPPGFMVHVNNLLMLIALFLFTPAARRGRVIYGMRHPMLAGFKVWAFAHLLVNGDLASIVLFASLLAWAVVEMIVINRAEGSFEVSGDVGSLRNDALFLVGSIGVLFLVGYLHAWFGVWPFPG